MFVRLENKIIQKTFLYVLKEKKVLMQGKNEKKY